jgi:hypothetical protein
VDGHVRRQELGRQSRHPRGLPHVQRVPARRGQAVAHDVPGGRDAVPRVRARAAAHAHDGLGRGRCGDQRGGVGRRRAALAVHGELVRRCRASGAPRGAARRGAARPAQCVAEGVSNPSPS